MSRRERFGSGSGGGGGGSGSETGGSLMRRRVAAAAETSATLSASSSLRDLGVQPLSSRWLDDTDKTGRGRSAATMVSGGTGSPPKGAGRNNHAIVGRILSQIHRAYHAKAAGLIGIGARMGIPLLAPRRKVTVLLLGNHSAGKSSFINWYIGEDVQKVGVAMETANFTLVTSGTSRDTLTGPATFKIFPHLEGLMSVRGIEDGIATEISTSRQRSFPLVTFIDTPGLVDGDQEYPFDVDSAIMWLGTNADLVFVFFDPQGQALCKHTVDVIEGLVARPGMDKRMKFFLSKADQAGTKTDRQRVLMQTAQNLCKRKGLNKIAFDLPTIYVPQPDQESECPNQVEELCDHIDKTISQTVQIALNRFDQDCKQVVAAIDVTIEEHRATELRNTQAWKKGMLFLWAGLALPILAALALVASLLDNSLESMLGNSAADHVRGFSDTAYGVYLMVPPEWRFLVGNAAAAYALVMLFVGSRLCKPKPLLGRAEVEALRQDKKEISSLTGTKDDLYAQYLTATVGDVVA